MRVQVNKYLRTRLDGENSSTLYCLCDNCRSEMYCEWAKSDYFCYKAADGQQKDIQLRPYSTRKKFPQYATVELFSDDWWQEHDYLKEHDWWQNRNPDDYLLWQMEHIDKLSREVAVVNVSKFHAFMKEIELAKAEQEYFENLQSCPVCHSKLTVPFKDLSGHYCSDFEDIDGMPSEEEVLQREKEYAKKNNLSFDGSTVFAGEDSNIFRMLRYALKNRDTRKAQTQLNALVARFDIPAPQSMDTSAIKQSSDNLKAYIQQLFSLETNIYSACRHLSDLYAQQWETNGAVHRRKGLTEIDIRQHLAHTEREYQTAAEKHAHIQEASVEAYYLEHRGADSKPKQPVFEKPGLFNKKKVLAHNEELQTKYQQAMLNFQQDAEAYYANALSAAEAEVAQAKARMERSAADIEVQIEAACTQTSPETVAKQMLDDEIAQAEKLLKELIECRNKLYAYDVVFIKYRNMVALAMFYEYLVSGRCTTLEGADGAYNIFEAECRANQIIGQLAKIVDSLEQIKESQYLIYSQLQSINRSLNAMNTTMRKMSKSLQDIRSDTHSMSDYMETVAKNSDVIAHNTAVSAYYSKMNAELTNSLGYLVALH